MKKENILLGAHMFIGKGFANAIKEGASIGCTTIQIFTKSSRSWSAKKITKDEIERFKETQKKSIIKIVVAHSSYLINIGSSNKNMENKSIKALAEELERCDMLGIPYLVLHPGSATGQDEEDCIKQIAKNLDIILNPYKGKTKIVLETTAGQGSNVGYAIEQLKKIRSLCKEKIKIGICIDTCHIFAAGYDIRTKESYKKTMSNIIKTIGLKNIKVIHLNDSKSDLGSRVDLHANIGKGKIPLQTFKLIMNDKNFFDIPKILETPIKTSKEYSHEIKLLKNMVD